MKKNILDVIKAEAMSASNSRSIFMCMILLNIQKLPFVNIKLLAYTHAPEMTV